MGTDNKDSDQNAQPVRSWDETFRRLDMLREEIYRLDALANPPVGKELMERLDRTVVRHST